MRLRIFLVLAIATAIAALYFAGQSVDGKTCIVAESGSPTTREVPC